MSSPEKLTSFYGVAGWTHERGIHDLLEEYLSPYGDSSFSRFSDVGASVIGRLISLLPASNLDDRQNNAPPLRDLCSAVLNRPDQITLSGYIVGPPRYDERVSIDGLLITKTRITSSTGWGAEPFGDERMRVWGELGELLGCQAQADNIPDEIVPINAPLVNLQESPQRTQGWWLWWD